MRRIAGKRDELFRHFLFNTPELAKHDDAIRHGLKVCELEPNEPFSFTAMSVTFQRAGKIPEAEDAMARARILQSGG